MSRERELLKEIVECFRGVWSHSPEGRKYLLKCDAILAHPEAEPAQDFAQKLADAQKPLPPEFQKVLNDNFWELVTEKPAPAAGETPETDENIWVSGDAVAANFARRLERQRNELRAENERLRPLAALWERRHENVTTAWDDLRKLMKLFGQSEFDTDKTSGDIVNRVIAEIERLRKELESKK